MRLFHQLRRVRRKLDSDQDLVMMTENPTRKALDRLSSNIQEKNEILQVRRACLEKYLAGDLDDSFDFSFFDGATSRGYCEKRNQALQNYAESLKGYLAGGELGNPPTYHLVESNFTEEILVNQIYKTVKTIFHLEKEIQDLESRRNYVENPHKPICSR